LCQLVYLQNSQKAFSLITTQWIESCLYIQILYFLFLPQMAKHNHLILITSIKLFIYYKFFIFQLLNSYLISTIFKSFQFSKFSNIFSDGQLNEQSVHQLLNCDVILKLAQYIVHKVKVKGLSFGFLLLSHSLSFPNGFAQTVSNVSNSS
jgi:hypothetical protein